VIDSEVDLLIVYLRASVHYMLLHRLEQAVVVLTVFVDWQSEVGRTDGL